MLDRIVVVLGPPGPLTDSVEAALQSSHSVLREVETEGVLRRLRDGWPDAIVIVDIETGRAGLDACREVRAASDVPMIVVSERDSEFDAVVALELGADDFIPAADAPSVIAMRCQLVLRRCNGPGGTAHDPSRPMVVGDLVVDPTACSVTLDGRTQTLPPRELAVLQVLVSSGGRVVPVSELLERASNGGRARSADTLEYVIRSLRAKIEDDPSSPSRIVNVRRLGYKYVRHDAHVR